MHYPISLLKIIPIAIIISTIGNQGTLKSTTLISLKSHKLANISIINPSTGNFLR